MQPDPIALLKDIRQAIQFITEDTASMTFDMFVRDRRTRQAVERNFEIIGEAMNRLRRRSPELFERFSAARQVIDFHNVVAHGYDVIDYVSMWQTVHQSLPVLRDEVDQFLQEMEVNLI